jgi:S1-C subfamily serine protease
MRYLFGGLMSLSLIACQSPSFEVCDVNLGFNKVQAMSATTRVAEKSRASTVKVVSVRPNGKAFGTGTVFKYKGQIVVMTAAHVVDTPDSLLFIEAETGLYAAKAVYVDSFADLAVLTVSEDMRIKAIPFRQAKQRQVKLGTDVVYSGFPNNSGLLTIEGYIAGMHKKGFLYMHSYGWSGASGSSVFDNEGRLVGILVALDVGPGIIGMPNIIEDVVIVVPIWMLNFDILDKSLNE